jgi:hypothetical protein
MDTNARVNMSIKIDDFELRQRHYRNHLGDSHFWSADLHRLTGEQFDALADAFPIERSGTVKTLSRDSGADFRACTISLGGLSVSIYTDDLGQPGGEFVPIEG